MNTIKDFEIYSEVIKSSPLFTGIVPEDISAMLTCLRASRSSYFKGEYILSAGSPARDVGLVLQGDIHIIKEDFWGNRSIIANIGPGELFGEAFACAGATSLPVNAVAAQDCAVRFIDYRKVITTCSSACTFHTGLIQNMLKILAMKNKMLMEKLGHMTKRSTREKLLSYLSEQAVKAENSHFTIPFDRQELADYLCVERSAMSAELSKLKKDGILDYRKNDFILKADKTPTSIGGE